MESIYNLYKYLMKCVITDDDSSDKYIIIELPKDISDEPAKQSEDIIKPMPIKN